MIVSTMNEQIQHTFKISEDFTSQRLDLVLSKLLPEYSRVTIQKWITNAEVLVNKKTTKPKYLLQNNDIIEVKASLIKYDEYQPEAIDFEIVHEDEGILIINKPHNLVVHPGAGNYTGTVLNGLLYKYPDSNTIPRAGIVHRLDKDTTGLMVIAKTLSSYYQLCNALKIKQIQRVYQAICYGNPPLQNTIIAPIGRNQNNRLKMCVTERGKYAETEYRVINHFNRCSHLEVKLITGRTHQIRVHLTHIGFPLVGDQTYKGNMPKQDSNNISNAIKQLNRQALHATQLTLTHPITNKIMQFNAPLPNDFQDILDNLQSQLNN